MAFFVSLIPAVSIKQTGIPPITEYASIVSRVVPGVSLVMARLLPSNVFKRVDLPTFGSPDKTIRAPEEIMRPSWYVFNNVENISCTDINKDRAVFSLSASTSSSDTSSSNSNKDKASISFSRKLISLLDKDPRTIRTFSLAASRDRECIRDATDSAWIKSSFPFK